MRISRGRLKPFGRCQESRSLFIVTKIDLRPGATEQEILNLCHSHCRSDHFVLIDEYKATPETFTLGATTSAWSSRGSAHGYRIFKKLS